MQNAQQMFSSQVNPNQTTYRFNSPHMIHRPQPPFFNQSQNLNIPQSISTPFSSSNSMLHSPHLVGQHVNNSSLGLLQTSRQANNSGMMQHSQNNSSRIMLNQQAQAIFNHQQHLLSPNYPQLTMQQQQLQQQLSKFLLAFRILFTQPYIYFPSLTV